VGNFTILRRTSTLPLWLENLVFLDSEAILDCDLWVNYQLDYFYIQINRYVTLTKLDILTFNK
jgi:hypothetical protein